MFKCRRDVWHQLVHDLLSFPKASNTPKSQEQDEMEMDLQDALAMNAAVNQLELMALLDIYSIL